MAAQGQVQGYTKQFFAQVSPPLEQGISHLANMYAIVGHLVASSNDQWLCELKVTMENMYFEFEESKKITEKYTSEVENELEGIVQQQHKLKVELTQIKTEHNNLVAEEKRLKDAAEEMNNQLKKAENELAYSKRDFDKKNRDLANSKQNQAIVGGVGVTLMIVPVFGWIAFAGGAMLTVTAATALKTAVQEAKETLTHAEEMVTYHDTRRRELGARTTEVASNLRKTKQLVEDNERSTHSLTEQETNLREDLRVCVKVNTIIKNIAFELCSIQNRLSVESNQLYSFDTAVKYLVEVETYFCKLDTRHLNMIDGWAKLQSVMALVSKSSNLPELNQYG